MPISLGYLALNIWPDILRVCQIFLKYLMCIQVPNSSAVIWCQALHVCKTFSMDFFKVRIINLFDDFLDNIILPDYSVSRKLSKSLLFPI